MAGCAYLTNSLTPRHAWWCASQRVFVPDSSQGGGRIPTLPEHTALKQVKNPTNFVPRSVTMADLPPPVQGPTAKEKK